MPMFEFDTPGWHYRKTDRRVLCPIEPAELWVLLRLAGPPGGQGPVVSRNELREDFHISPGWDPSYLRAALDNLFKRHWITGHSGNVWITSAGLDQVRPALRHTSVLHRLGQIDLADEMHANGFWVWFNFHEPSEAISPSGLSELPDLVIVPLLGQDTTHMIAGESELDPGEHSSRMFNNLCRNINDQMPTIFTTPRSHADSLRATLERSPIGIELVKSWRDFTNPRQVWVTAGSEILTPLEDIHDIETVREAIKAVKRRGAKLAIYKDWLFARYPSSRMKRLGKATPTIHAFKAAFERGENLQNFLDKLERRWTPLEMVQALTAAREDLRIVGEWVYSRKLRVCRVTKAVRDWIFSKNPLPVP